MPCKDNQDQVAIVTEKLGRAKSATVVDYAGTTVNNQVDLRRELRKVNAEFFVTKNTLINIATGGKLKASLDGMNALVLSYDDEVAGLKQLFAWQKKNEKLTIKTGVVGDLVLNATEIETLSKLPGKKELMATLISRLQGPAYGLVNVLSANMRNLVYVVSAIEKRGVTA